MLTGKIFDIKKYAVHDGPGIRTTVFFKGCPLACRWCHNPESISCDTQRLYRKDRCIGCGECAEACVENAVQVSGQGLQWWPNTCIFCGTCAGICPGDAVELIGKTMTVESVMAEITKDVLFYDQSAGGVTISGGEPLMQPTFLTALLDACGKLELHRTLDTSGYGDIRDLLDAAARTELFLYDLKHMDPDIHLAMTGVSNAMILSNLEALAKTGTNIIVRIPIIPGINSDAANIERTGAFVSSLPGVNRVNILPYHGAAVAKYHNLGSEFQTPKIERPSQDFLESIAAILEKFNLNVKIGG
ncbi:MAG: glycyl-radical enzyme activating protein [Desulfobacterales bacterium]|nr:glycyl-radical enzyme activating protein [Desulfobacterales bacterium]